MEIAIGVGVTIGLAIITGLCWLAFNDYPAFNKVMRKFEIPLGCIGFMGVGIVVGASLSAWRVGVAGQLIVGASIAGVAVAIFLVAGFLEWLRREV